MQIRLEAFSRTLTRLVLAITAAILIIGLLSGRPFLEMLRVSIILAIAAIPEGLLIAVTVILVLGMRKILKRNGLVKRLLAVETLGSVTTICTDKTGTLTEGRMKVTRVAVNDPQRALEVMMYCNDLEGPVDAALWEYARRPDPRFRRSTPGRGAVQQRDEVHDRRAARRRGHRPLPQRGTRDCAEDV